MPNTYDLSGKTAIVTGAGKGIGRAIAQCLVTSGCQVWSWDEHPRDLAGVRSETINVTDAAQVATAITRIEGRQARVDILINNAGYLGELHHFEAHDPNDWSRIIRVNLIGMMTVTQALLPHMRATGGGRIINMGSLAGKEGLAQLAAYPPPVLV